MMTILCRLARGGGMACENVYDRMNAQWEREMKEDSNEKSHGSREGGGIRRGGWRRVSVWCGK